MAQTLNVSVDDLISDEASASSSALHAMIYANGFKKKDGEDKFILDVTTDGQPLTVNGETLTDDEKNALVDYAKYLIYKRDNN